MRIEVVFFIFCVVASAYVSAENDDIQTYEFDVKPGGGTYHFENSEPMDGVTCTFTYQAQGGTNEKWAMQLERRHNHVVCMVERPSRLSYLFFQSFKLKVSGISVVKGEVYGNNNVPLKEEEYSLDKSSKTISDVQGKFQSQLSAVIMSVSTHTEEL